MVIYGEIINSNFFKHFFYTPFIRSYINIFCISAYTCVCMSIIHAFRMSRACIHNKKSKRTIHMKLPGPILISPLQYIHIDINISHVGELMLYKRKFVVTIGFSNGCLKATLIKFPEVHSNIREAFGEG